MFHNWTNFFLTTAAVGAQLRSQRKLDFAALHGVDWIAHNALPVVADAILICGGAGLIAGKPFAPVRRCGREYAPVDFRDLWRLGSDPMDGHQSGQDVTLALLPHSE